MNREGMSDDEKLCGFGLAPIKREGRHCTFEPENLDDMVHVQVKLKNMILDKKENEERSKQCN